MKRPFLTISFLFVLTLAPAQAETPSLEQNLSGHILLAVESKGEAWYINPFNLKRYYLGRPNDAFYLMRNLGTGITDENLEKIALGTNSKIYNGADRDQDGLSDEIEVLIKSDPNKTDSDNDGYDDGHEILNNYSPIGPQKLKLNSSFAKAQAGKIFLQVESKGEAWYINPLDHKRYYLGRPNLAFQIMKEFGLGISTSNLTKIEIFEEPSITPPPGDDDPNYQSEENILKNAATAIRNNNVSLATSYFTPTMETAVKYTLNFLGDEGRLTLGNIISGASLASRTNDTLTYTNEVYFSLGDYKVPIKFLVKKQADGKWLMTNL